MRLLDAVPLWWLPPLFHNTESKVPRTHNNVSVLVLNRRQGVSLPMKPIVPLPPWYFQSGNERQVGRNRASLELCLDVPFSRPALGIGDIFNPASLVRETLTIK